MKSRFIHNKLRSAKMKVVIVLVMVPWMLGYPILAAPIHATAAGASSALVSASQPLSDSGLATASLVDAHGPLSLPEHLEPEKKTLDLGADSDEGRTKRLLVSGEDNSGLESPSQTLDHPALSSTLHSDPARDQKATMMAEQAEKHNYPELAVSLPLPELAEAELKTANLGADSYEGIVKRPRVSAESTLGLENPSPTLDPPALPSNLHCGPACTRRVNIESEEAEKHKKLGLAASLPLLQHAEPELETLNLDADSHEGLVKQSNVSGEDNAGLESPAPNLDRPDLPSNLHRGSPRTQNVTIETADAEKHDSPGLADSSSLSASSFAANAASHGRTTVYAQNGNAGANGQVHGEWDMILAVSHTRNPVQSGLCGRRVGISSNGKTIHAYIADQCQSCGWDDIDLSKGAFNALFGTTDGMFYSDWWME